MKKYVGYFSALLIIAAVFLSLSLHTVADDQESAALLLAHRGYAEKYPENTVRAFKAAYRNGFDGIELDLYQSQYGQLLVHHDKNIKRMTGINKLIWKLTPEQRKTYLIQNKYKIPTLGETFKALSEKSGPILVHIKLFPKDGYMPTDDCLKKINKLAKRYKVKNRVIIFGTREAIEPFVGRYGFAYGATFKESDYDSLQSLVKWGVKNDIRMIMMIHLKQLEEEGERKVALVHDKGISLGMYYVNNMEELEKINELKFEYGMSDYKLK